MQVPAERWHQAIQVRHSRRKFVNKPINTADLEGIHQICQKFRPFGNTAYGVLVAESPDQVFKGLVGSYGKIKGSQAYIAFVGNTDDPHVEEKVGYVGEGIILELTSLSFDTCWIGGFFKPEIVSQQINLGPEEKVYCVTPVGYSADYSLTERLMSAMVKSRKRKPIEKLCADWDYNGGEKWQQMAIADARLAPSGVNRQPWLFTVHSDEIIVSVDSQQTNNLSKRVDCGIAMLHLEVGAMTTGKLGEWEFLLLPQIARFKIVK